MSRKLRLADRDGLCSLAYPVQGASSGILTDFRMSSERDVKQPERNTDLSVRASTLLLLLALGGLLLRLTGAAHWLEQVAPVAATLLALLAPAWALCGSVFASAYLVLSMWRPYNAVQHLLEMGLGVLLTVLMLPAF